MSDNRLRLRDLPFLPLLLLLHLVFTVSSLFLRVYELLTRPEDDLPPPKNTNPPKHVAVVFSSSSSTGRSPASPLNTRKGRRSAEEKAALASVRSAVEWAAEEGVERLSFYEQNGLLQKLEDHLVDALAPRPMSPPSSTPSSPVPRTRLEARPSSEDERWNVRTLSVFPSPSRPSRRTSPNRKSQERLLHEVRRDPITIHLIPPADDLIPSITRSLVAEGIPSEGVTQVLINARVEEKLQCPSPDLLIIHPLHLPSFPCSLLPRPAPELWGYPFWTLRITEIYQHPPPLPLSPLQPVLNLARRSTMPLIRKFGNLLPELDADCDVEGALGRDEWEGAMRAWSEVEQRLGK